MEKDQKKKSLSRHWNQISDIYKLTTILGEGTFG